MAAALQIVETTGAAAVMVARGVAGNPWLVGELLSGRSAARPPLPAVVADLRLLLALVVEERGPERAARWMRKLLGWYLRPRAYPCGDRTAARAARRRGAGRGIGDAEASLRFRERTRLRAELRGPDEGRGTPKQLTYAGCRRAHGHTRA